MSHATERFGLDPLLVLLFFALASGGAWVLWRAFGRQDGPWADLAGSSSQKLAQLQGMRGILAMAVVAHHACCWYYFLQSGTWSTGPSVLFDHLGNFGVLQFFYLSGFLFWRKLIRHNRLPASSFYLSRFLRIGPVYYVSIGAAILLGLTITGLPLHVPLGNFLASLTPWLIFSIGGRPNVNHADILRISCGVTWTLALEWLFYLSLPFLGWFSRKAWRFGVYVAAFGALYVLSRLVRESSAASTSLIAIASGAATYSKFMLIGFGGGILVAATEGNLRLWLRGLERSGNWIALGCYGLYLLTPGHEGLGQVLLQAPFAFVALGADLFGFLTSSCARLLGAISYPVYLVHGIVYYAAMLLRGGMHEVGLGAYLAESVACLAAILVLATALHLFVERPTMKISEQIAHAAR